MIETDLPLAISGVSTRESYIVTTKNLVEDTGAIAKPRVTGTNITISIALVNSRILGIKAKESEKIRIRTQTKSGQNHARIDGKVL